MSILKKPGQVGQVGQVPFFQAFLHILKLANFTRSRLVFGMTSRSR